MKKLTIMVLVLAAVFFDAGALRAATSADITISGTLSGRTQDDEDLSTATSPPVNADSVQILVSLYASPADVHRLPDIGGGAER
jgi:hypothetical protein